MERKLYKKELALWKEVTKEDIKINKYTSEELTEDFKSSIEKRPKALKKKIKDKKEEDSLNIKEKLLENNKLQVNKRMKAKFERGLIRPEAKLDLHGYNRVEAEKTGDLL